MSIIFDALDCIAQDDIPKLFLHSYTDIPTGISARDLV